MAHAPVYVGNYEYDADERELEEAFNKYGRITSIEYKTGFCFVHFENERDASDAIHAMDSREWGPRGRKLRVEFAKNDANVRARETARRDAADPNTTLFVAGFDPRATRTKDLEKAFEGFGRMKRCEVKKTFAFVEYENIEDAKDALTTMHGNKIDGRDITVEYVNKKPRVDREFRGGDRRGDRRDDRGGGGGGRDRFDDRDNRRDDRRGGGGGGGRNGGGGYDDRDRGRARFDDRRGGGGGYGGGGGGGRRDRSRSYERRDRRRRSPSFDRRDRMMSGGGGGNRSPPARRGRSVSPRRPPPRQMQQHQRGRPRSPGGAVPVRRGESPSRSPP